MTRTPYASFHFFCFRPDCYPQDKEYDSWNSIADYVFQVIPTFVSSLSHSTLSMEEFKRYIGLNASSGSRGDSCGRRCKLGKFTTLTLWQMGDASDISSLLARHKPRIIVDDEGGELLLSLPICRIVPHFSQWRGLFVERRSSPRLPRCIHHQMSLVLRMVRPLFSHHNSIER